MDLDPIAAAGHLAARLAAEPAPAPALLASSGLLGITVPAEGGPRCSVATLAEVHRLIATAERDVARLLHGHHLFLRALSEQGTRDQQGYFFAEARAGACFGGVGPGFGGPDDRITLARWRNGVYRLDGESLAGPGVLLADWLVVRAVLVDELAEPADEPDQVFAVIRRDELGVTHDGGPAGPVWLDGVRVAAGCVVPYSTLFDRPSTYEARRLATEAALAVPDRDLLREAAETVDRAERDLTPVTVAQALAAVRAVTAPEAAALVPARGPLAEGPGGL